MDQRIGRQGGWVGLIVILLALAIVAWLARDALKGYGLLPPATTTKAGTPGERARAAAVGGVEATDTSPVTAAPQTAIDRARGVEDTVKRAAEHRVNQGDGVSR